MQRPQFHLVPPRGWCNDPNGVIWWKDRLHVFYQHYPHANHWGPMHWGHASSADFLNWEHHPVALRPEAPYERHPTGGGCYSGSAAPMDGGIAAMYTAHGWEHGKDVETQCIATSSDGIHFTRHPGNPVLRSGDKYPAHDFRDPRLWQHNGRWYAVVGTRVGERGAAVLFASEDLAQWREAGVLRQTEGTMCECPDFFEVDGRHVLIYSPCGRNPRRVMAVVGDFSYETLKFTAAATHPVDEGPDFYAPQTACDGQGRRVLVGWLGNWAHDVPQTMQDAGFAWGITLPRLLRVRGERLESRPANRPAVPVISTSGNCPPAFEVCLRRGQKLSMGSFAAELSREGLSVHQTMTRKGHIVPAQTHVAVPATVESVQMLVDAWSAEFFWDGGGMATFSVPEGAPERVSLQ